MRWAISGYQSGAWVSLSNGNRLEIKFNRGGFNMNNNQSKILLGLPGKRRMQIGTWGAMMMKISSLMALVMVMGCIANSNGGTVRNRCSDAPPPFDNTKINPGMYILQGADTSVLPTAIQIYCSNGILYTRSRNYADNATNAIGSSATESWDRYLDSGDQIIGVGSGEIRGKSSITGLWNQTWSVHGGAGIFSKSNVNSNSFQRLRKTEIRDNDGNLIDCSWDTGTLIRIGNDQSPWPSLVNWPEVWPDSVKRNTLMTGKRNSEKTMA